MTTVSPSTSSTSSPTTTSVAPTTSSTVPPTTPTTPPKLPETGIPVAALLMLGIGLGVLGSAALIGTRKK